MTKNSDIPKAFIYGDEQSTSNGAFYTKKINGVFVVFSWGYHFPIAVNFCDGFLFNKNGYSQSTTRHKNLILAEIEDDLNEEDFKTTAEMCEIVNKIRYDNIKTKAELIEAKI